MLQDFLGNQVIRYLSKKSYWTVNVDNKKPLDIVGYEQTGIIAGARNESCLTDLSSLIQTVGAVPAQFVYHLNAVRDKIVVLDIEKTCPEDLKDTLLNLPFIYGDISVSGKGCHLIFPCPELDEITSNKIVMKDPNGYFEVLLNHYVTFTSYTLFPRYTKTNAPIQFWQVWDGLRQIQKNIVKKNLDIEFNDMKLDFPYYNELKAAVIGNFRKRFNKTPSDFGNDMSRYEFAVIGSVRYALSFMLNMPIFSRRIKLDEREKILFVYKIVSEILLYREKHSELRNGKPLLLYQTYNSFASE